MRNALKRPLGGQGKLLAIDPGTKGTGLAYFNKGLLTLAVLERDPYTLKPGPEQLDEVIVELPRAYGARSPVDPNDLIKLASVAGFIAGISGASTLWYVHPQSWKGQTPKRIDNERTIRHLCDNERRILGPKLDHNVMDAVGIGLWALGRR